MLPSYMWFVFFFNDTATTEIYTLSLHDALPILVSEKWKCKGVRFGVMESDEAILRVEDFLQRLMDAPQEFIQVCGFVEGMHDLGDDLSLGFHPVKIGDVPRTDDNAPDGRQVGMIPGGSIEPAPTPGFAPQPAAAS